MKPETILIFEDDPDDVFLLKRCIKGAGLTNPLEFVSNGEEGLRILEEAIFDSKKGAPLVLPLFVLLDLKMPEMNGFEVLTRIRGMPELAQLVIVITSGSDVDTDIGLAYELGARSYLVKPPTSAELQAIAKYAKEMASPEWLRPKDFPGVPRPGF